MTGFRGPPGFTGRQGVKGKQVPIILCSLNTPHWTITTATTTTTITKGDEGSRGLPGIPGLLGPKGEKGDTGDLGQPGVPGSAGQKGEPDGAAGNNGDKGNKGDEGQMGIAGQGGPKGDKGDMGLMGMMAFAAGLESSYPPPQAPVVFSQVLYNIQGSYDPSTGIYTAPVNGTYILSYHITVHERVLKVGLFHNFRPVIKTTETKLLGTTSHSVVLHLARGHRVWIQVKDQVTNGMFAGIESSSTFSGYLLHPDNCDMTPLTVDKFINTIDVYQTMHIGPHTRATHTDKSVLNWFVGFRRTCSIH
uniref:C1q domain-containing protein n=1 Tax=Dicentrarchus labrax TaxID=13489 RepID=A0A8P4KKG0_DICLA